MRADSFSIFITLKISCIKIFGRMLATKIRKSEISADERNCYSLKRLSIMQGIFYLVFVIVDHYSSFSGEIIVNELGIM